MSYARFSYSDLTLSATSPAAGAPLTLSLALTNTGTVEVEEVAQVYLSDLETSVPAPQHKLVDFQRAWLESDESQRLTFALTAEALSLVDEEGQLQLEPGQFRVTIGGCSPGARGVALGAPAPLTAEFVVTP